ncbi:pyridoxal phosphate-dependent aminotransferase, partial [Thermaurantiacus sp.]
MLAAGGAEAFAILDRARALQSQGRDIIALSIGQPEAPAPAAAIAAAQAALAAGRTGYAPLLGEPALRRAIAEARGVAADEVVVLPGAQAALAAVLHLVCGEGDEVLSPDPHYATYAGTAASAGARLVGVAMDPPAFALDVGRLAQAITARTRAVLVNSPANPTGRTIDAAGFRALAALCLAHDLWLISDEVYSALTYSGGHVSALVHGPPGRTIVLDSLSKSHAMTGFRIGWAIAPACLMPAFEEWSAAAIFGVAPFVQDAAIAALAVPEAELRAYRASFARRAGLAADTLGSLPGCTLAPPDGGMFVFLHVGGDDLAFARALLEEARVCVLPGSAFG